MNTLTLGIGIGIAAVFAISTTHAIMYKQWWAFAILLPAGTCLGWTLRERKQRNP